LKVFLFKDCFRLEGLSGNCVETDFAKDFIKYDSRITLPTAKRQFLSFQVGIESDNSVKGLEIKMSDLKLDGTADGEDKICSSNYETFIQWCHKVDGRLIPDLLVPMSTGYEFSIPQDPEYHHGQKAGAVWVDLFIPEETSSGTFTGDLAVKANGETFNFGIVINIYNIITPEKGKVTADMNSYADSVSQYSSEVARNQNRYKDGTYNELEKKIVCVSREHRTVYHQLPYKHSGYIPESFCPELEGEGKDMRVRSWELYDKHYGPYLDGSAFKGSRVSERPIEYLYSPFNLLWPASYEKFGLKGYRTEYRRIMMEFVRHFEEKGWTETIFETILNNKKDYRYVPYTTDEVWYEHDRESIDLFYEIIKDTYQDSKAKFVWRQDDSNHWGNHFHTKYMDMIEMWVVGSSMFSWFPEAVPIFRNKGNIIFVYGGIWNRMQTSLLSANAWPFYCFMTGAHGFVAWNATAYGDYLNTPTEDGAQAVYYPGEFFGTDPLPNIRLKSLRNAMQLNDVAMITAGTRFKEPMQTIINKHFNKASMEDWWKEKPPFYKEPPRYWDFGPDFEQFCLEPAYVKSSPVILENMSYDVYAMIEKSAGKSSNRIIGQFG